MSSSTKLCENPVVTTPGGAQKGYPTSRSGVSAQGYALPTKVCGVCFIHLGFYLFSPVLIFSSQSEQVRVYQGPIRSHRWSFLAKKRESQRRERERPEEGSESPTRLATGCLCAINSDIYICSFSELDCGY